MHDLIIDAQPRVKAYPAKLLLFGEYTVLDGSQALAVPLHAWTGKWVRSGAHDAYRSIPAYFAWLLNNQLIDEPLYKRMADDVHEGWTYQSDIPIGYGAGSSGALVAALYDRYMGPDEKDPASAGDILAKMESYFHGASSGMDPLVSYSDTAVYKDEEGKFHFMADKGWPHGFKLYLLDSGMSRETSALVNIYAQKKKESNLSGRVRKQLIPAVEHAIHLYLTGEGKMLEECVSIISHFQRMYFEEVIPDHVKVIWDALSGLEGCYVKLCGAGGGGFFMVIATGDIPDADGLIAV